MTHRAKTGLKAAAAVAALLLVGSTASTAVAGSTSPARAKLTGFEEVPAVSTDGHGAFHAKINRSTDTIHYRLRYGDLEGDVLQAHIHLGQRSVAGGVAAFLCTNVGGGSADTPACPQDGVVTGTLDADDVIGPAGQGLAAGEFDELVKALRAGVTYVNVHSSLVPSGEIRGQIKRGHHD